MTHHTLSNPVAIDRNGILPVEYVLHQNYPNPINPITTISYALAEMSEVKLTIYDITGREVATIVTRQQTTGYHDVQWSGLNTAGNLVSTGVYFCRLEAGSYSQTIKIVCLR